MVPACLALIAGLAAAVNLWLYVQSRWADLWAEVQITRNATPEVRMFEAAKGMHPEAVKALLVHRRTIWRMKYIPLRDVVDWVLDEAPNVHGGFVDFVLDHSNGTLMPKRLLVEGSTKFDPDGLVTDYQQYDDLLMLMQSKLMCTQAYGNQAPHFLPPWTVELVRHRFGLDGAGYQVDEEMSEALKAVVKDQAPLSATQTSPQMGERNLATMETVGGDAKVDIDKARADEIRREANEALQAIMRVQDKATKYGFVLNYAIGRNAIGLHMLNDLTVLKIL
jgi:hypothetical protein